MKVVSDATYDIKLRFDALNKDGEATLSCGAISVRQPIKAGETECVFKGVRLPIGPARFESTVVDGPSIHGVKYVELNRS